MASLAKTLVRTLYDAKYGVDVEGSLLDSSGVGAVSEPDDVILTSDSVTALSAGESYVLSKIDEGQPEPTIIVRADGAGNYTTVAGALAVAGPSDIVEIQANSVGGTQYFNERLTLPNNGAGPGQEITLRARDGDTIVLYATGGGLADIITPSNNSYWIFEGWAPSDPADTSRGLQFGRDETLNGWSYATGRDTVEHSQAWAGADDFGSHHITFRNCRFYGGSAYDNIFLRPGVHHFGFINCVGSHVGSPDIANLVTTDGGPQYILYKNCRSFFVGHSGWQMTGSWHVARNCFEDGSWTQYAANVYHRAFTSEGSKGSLIDGRTLIDGNAVHNGGKDHSGSIRALAKIGGFGAIVRRNYFFDTFDSCDATNATPLDSDIPQAGDYWRIYNNTYYNVESVFESTDFNIGAANNEHFLESVWKNNLAWNIKDGNLNDADNAHFKYARGNSTKRAGDENDWRGAIFTNNVFHTVLNDFRVKLAGDGGDVSTNLADAESTWPNQWYGNSSTQPSMPNIANRTSGNYNTVVAAFALGAGSEGENAAEAMTLTNGTGNNSTTLVVDDAGYFYAGADPNTWDLGYFGEEGDWIKVGSNSPVQIDAINYGTNTITLATAITWGDADEVWLCDDSGSAPITNIGANQS